MFNNRKEAGLCLANALKEQGVEFDLVMAVPRGGVLVAEPLAEIYKKPMDVVMVKKIDSPSIPDKAVGAVMPDGEIILQSDLTSDELDQDREAVQRLAHSIRKQINQRLSLYRSYKPALDIRGKRVLLVDDGIASGFTIKGAISYLKRHGANKVTTAVPVCSPGARSMLEGIADKMVSLEVPSKFYAVSLCYHDYTDIEDAEVIEILKTEMINPELG